jgi:hypothetical protein
MNFDDAKGGGELIKGFGELLKSIGPTDEQRQAFGRTFFGTLLGQTIVLIGTILVYIGAVAVIWKYWSEDLKTFHSDVGESFWLILAAPFVCILLFSILPTAWQARRESRMKAAAISGDTHFDGTNFRPYPYQETDRAAFKRLDGADRNILNWLTSTRASLLYFSGASGVGKSSLLAASVLPQLRDAGWRVIETRLFGDPIERLRTALLDSETRLAKKADGEMPFHELLKKAADARTRKGAAPLLLVIDQFEEFLIRHKHDERGKFAVLLGDLATTPIVGLRIMLVFRSDYRSLVFKLDLPPLVAGQNWHELAPYDRDESMAFLRSGGRTLSTRAIERLFRGLDRIEETPGMYRLITLNMVGLVLERMGRVLEGDPGRLIQSYLTMCLMTGESRDFAKPLLASMISGAGTTEPRSEADLVKETGFAPWQVKATLAELARHGLVRQLDAATATWEIAHDFLARAIGQLIGHLNSRLFERARPLIGPLALLGWIILAVVALPNWQVTRELEAEHKLQAMYAVFSQPYLEHANFEEVGRVKIGFAHGLVDEEANTAATYLWRIRGPISIDISSRASRISDLGPFKNLTNIAALDLGDTARITNLEPLSGMKGLIRLRLTGAIGIRSLEPIQNLTKLDWLDLHDATGITSLEPLRGLKHLSRLDLGGATGITSLVPLKGLKNLDSLDLSGATGITSLEPLSGLTELRYLNLSNAAGITSLEPLKGLKQLRMLNLARITGIKSLEPLKGLPHLLSLNLTGATGVTSLEPLKGRKIQIEGASPELVTTKE